VSSLHSPSTTRRSTPTRRGRAGLAATAVVLAAAPFAAACGAGFNSASEDVKPNAAAGTVGDLRVNNVWVIVDQNSGTAEVIGAVTNTGDAQDQLTAATAGGSDVTFAAAPAGSAGGESTGKGVTVAADGVTVPGGESVSFGEQGSPGLSIVGGGLVPGHFTTVKLTFAQAGTLTLTAEVEPDTGLFVGYDPNTYQSPSPSPSPSEANSASASASASASSSASASASASASPSASK